MLYNKVWFNILPEDAQKNVYEAGHDGTYCCS